MLSANRRCILGAHREDNIQVAWTTYFPRSDNHRESHNSSFNFVERDWLGREGTWTYVSYLSDKQFKHDICLESISVSWSRCDKKFDVRIVARYQPALITQRAPWIQPVVRRVVALLPLDWSQMKGEHEFAHRRPSDYACIFRLPFSLPLSLNAFFVLQFPCEWRAPKRRATNCARILSHTYGEVDVEVNEQWGCHTFKCALAATSLMAYAFI